MKKAIFFVVVLAGWTAMGQEESPECEALYEQERAELARTFPPTCDGNMLAPHCRQFWAEHDARWEPRFEAAGCYD